MSNHWEVVNSGSVKVSNTPQELWDNAVDYFKWCDENPILTKVTATSGREAGKKFEQENPRPYTLKGLCLHCGIVEEYLKDIYNSKEESSLYYIVVSKILYIIHIQISEYAMIGVFNPGLSGKMLSIDKTEEPSKPIRVEIFDTPELSTSEEQILERLEAENSLFKKPDSTN